MLCFYFVGHNRKFKKIVMFYVGHNKKLTNSNDFQDLHVNFQSNVLIKWAIRNDGQVFMDLM